MKHAIIIVTFNPCEIALRSTVSRLLGPNRDIIIVDNGSFKFPDFYDVDCIFLGYNAGIAFAQNVGIRRALQLDSDYITFLDQDTSITSDQLERLLKKLQASDFKAAAPLCKDAVRLKLYDVVTWDYSTSNLRRDVIRSESGDRVSNIVISSGLTVRAEIFNDDMFMSEELFIDYVDTEWCFRFCESGEQILIVEEVVLLHSIGDYSIDLWFFVLPVHKPHRRFYRLRNSFLLFTFPWVPMSFCLRNFFVVVAQQALLVALVPGQRCSYVRVSFSAFRCGVRGVASDLLRKIGYFQAKD